jgi:hypothetical protein
MKHRAAYDEGLADAERRADDGGEEDDAIGLNGDAVDQIDGFPQKIDEKLSPFSSVAIFVATVDSCH